MAGNLAFLLGLPAYVWMFCFLLGLILCVVEAFMPGFGVFGISGGAFFVLGIVLCARSLTDGLLMLLGVIVVFSVLAILSFRSAAGGRLSRSPLVLGSSSTREDGYVGVEDLSFFVGKTGTVLTTLRPAGVCEIEGARLDVVSEGEFLGPKTAVKVIKVEGRRVIVEPVA